MGRKKTKCLVLAALIVLLTIAGPGQVSGASANFINLNELWPEDVVKEDWNYNASTHVLHLTKDWGHYNLTGKFSSFSRVRVADGVRVKVVLHDVLVDVSKKDAVAFDCGSGSSVELWLMGSSTLVSGAGEAGLRVPSGSSLSVNSSSFGKLTAVGGLSARQGAWGGAGIGAGHGESAGKIVIRNGEIEARSNNGGAGIGVGPSSGSTFDQIIIRNGTVMAQGSRNGPGIGGTGRSGYGEIEIRSGIIQAMGGYGGAGIGGGAYGEPSSISILSGQVTGQGGPYGAGIGNGSSGKTGAPIRIDAGKVRATGGHGGAGIGATGASVRIASGSVIATGGEGGAGIGGGLGASGCPVSITGLHTQVQAAGTDGGYDIGSGASTGGALSGGRLAISQDPVVVLMNNRTNAST